MEMTVNDEKSFRFSLLCLRMICPKSMADFFTLYAGFVQSLWMISINFARFMHAALFLRDLCYWSAAADVETGRSCVSKPRFDSLCNLYRLHLSLFAEFYTLVVQYICTFYAFPFFYLNYFFNPTSGLLVFAHQFVYLPCFCVVENKHQTDVVWKM